jgi:hypothetical protein
VDDAAGAGGGARRRSRLRLYRPGLGDFSRYSRVETPDGREVPFAEYLEKVWEVVGRAALLHDYIPPSTSVVMERCFAAPATISTSLIAVMPEAGYEIRKVHPPGVASAPTSGFVPAVVCDEFVFVLTCKDAVRFALFETGGDSAHVHPYPEPKAARIDGPRAHRRTRMRS